MKDCRSCNRRMRSGCMRALVKPEQGECSGHRQFSWIKPVEPEKPNSNGKIEIRGLSSVPRPGSPVAPKLH